MIEEVGGECKKCCEKCAKCSNIFILTPYAIFPPGIGAQTFVGSPQELLAPHAYTIQSTITVCSTRYTS